MARSTDSSQGEVGSEDRLVVPPESLLGLDTRIPEGQARQVAAQGADLAWVAARGLAGVRGFAVQEPSVRALAGPAAVVAPDPWQAAPARVVVGHPAHHPARPVWEVGFVL